MKVRNTGDDRKIELQMTPMIDIVFQLLIFFIMTFKVVAQEGDFNIKMPLAAQSEGLPDEDKVPPMKLRLTADGAGNVAGIDLNGNSFSSFVGLRNYIIGFLGDDRGPGSIQETAEVEIDPDPNLRYEFIIESITAVSGEKRGDQLVTLVEKIKFAPPRE